MVTECHYLKRPKEECMMRLGAELRKLIDIAHIVNIDNRGNCTTLTGWQSRFYKEKKN